MLALYESMKNVHVMRFKRSEILDFIVRREKCFYDIGCFT